MNVKYTKIIAAVCAAAMLCTAFSSCSKSGDKGSSAGESSSANEEEVVKPAEFDGVKYEPSDVEFSKPSGCYAENLSLELTAAEGAEIYYTTDGSNPAVSDTAQKYSSAIEIKDRSGDKNVVSAVDPSLFDAANVEVNADETGFDYLLSAPTDSAVDKCTVVRAAAKTGESWSTPVSATYFYGTMEDHIEGIAKSCEASGNDLAVISISADYDDMFDAEKGIYVKGNIFDNSLSQWIASGEDMDADTSRRLEANYTQRGKEWERAVSIDMFEADASGAELVLSQDCGIRVQGNYSRSDLQKGFRLYARSDYGENNFKYAVFGDDLKDDSGKTMDKFKVLTLRAGGNCAFTTKYSDTYWQTLLDGLDVETQESRPCVVYLNGEYWGLYVLQEDYTDDYFEDTHGVNKDDVVVYKGDAEKYSSGYKLDEGKLPDGETDESYFLKDLQDFFKNHKSLSEQADYDEFCKLVDPESVRDYFAVESWVNNKWDWPGKNWSMWKTANVEDGNEYADGRWRLLVYDIEFGGVSGGQDAYTNTIKEDNYKTNGLLDMGTNNPAVLSFAYLMTNEGFRNDFYDKLNSLSETNFEKTAALEQLDKINSIYEPLYDQFFERYPDTGSADNSVNGGYASKQCIADFLEKRADNIQQMIDFCEQILA